MFNSDLLYNQALKYVGTSEVEGIGVNELIKSWVAWAMPWVKNELDIDSRYAWCAIFISKMMSEINLLPNQKPIVAARKFITIGNEIINPKRGDLIILDRGIGKGHIGLFDQVLINGKYRLLGGNQANKVGFNDFNPNRILAKRTLNVED